MSKYTTGELAKLCGVTVRTVQYYDTRDILSPSELSEGGRRLYTDDDLRQLRIICFLRDMGLPIDAIGQLLAEEEPGRVIQLLLEQQEQEVRRQLAQSQSRLKKLEELGYRSMTATYAQYYGGAALINCAATQNGVILYNDLIKVWVDRETNEVTGVDARNYLFSHTERELPEASVTMAEAEGYLASSLKVMERQLALIPITPETERLCYEFKCTSGNNSYIVYIGVETGEEEQIFRIIDSEDGQLVI